MKLLILGGGPGGYVAAIRAAQLGAEVTIVEKKYFGGTCMNVGCIPTKVLLHTTDLYHELLKSGKKLGIKTQGAEVDWNRLMDRKAEVVRALVKSVESLLISNQVTILFGEGRFLSANQVEVISENGDRQLSDFDYAIVATGSEPVVPPIPGIMSEGIMTSNEILSMETLPKSLSIIGGGVIGSEFASLFSRLGVEVSIVEMLPRIVQTMDEEIVNYLDFELRNQGVKILTKSKVESFEAFSGGVRIQVSSAEGNQVIESEKVLLSIGRRPVLSNLGLEKIGVKIDKGIAVKRNMQTNVSNIYAIGDCTGGVMLAHVASAQGIVAVEAIMNKKSKMDFRTIPYCIYTKPEIASVGMTEDQARKAGINYIVGRFPLMSNGKALILGEAEGLVKFIVDAKTDEVLGMHMAGPKATELIVEGAMALRLEATVDEIITTIHAHPTVAEAIQESAHAIHGNAIHLPK